MSEKARLVEQAGGSSESDGEQPKRQAEQSAASSDEEARPEPPKAQKPAVRLPGLDLFRGFIMVVMSWDHARDFLVKGGANNNEYFSGPLPDYAGSGNWLVVLQRVLSHLCAPGFFYTMGVGMTMFSMSRVRQGWTVKAITWHFAVRGVVLLIGDRFVNLSWELLFVPRLLRGTVHGANYVWRWLALTQVLTALGSSMALSGPLVALSARWRSWKLKPFCGRDFGELSVGAYLLILLGIIAMLISAISITIVQARDPEILTRTSGFSWPDAQYHSTAFGEFILRYLVFPGKVGGSALLYPLFPWIGMCWFGIASGFRFREDEEYAHRRLLGLSMVSLGAFLLVRTLGGAGPNFRGYPRGEEFSDAGIAFITVCKYPPSIAFLLLTFGINGMILCLLQNVTKSASDSDTRLARAWMTVMKPLEVFGQSSLFFYLIHFWMLALVGSIFDNTFGQVPLSLGWVPWIGILVVLFYCCKKYSAFKATTDANSLWRLL